MTARASRRRCCPGSSVRAFRPPRGGPAAAWGSADAWWRAGVARSPSRACSPAARRSRSPSQAGPAPPWRDAAHARVWQKGRSCTMLGAAEPSFARDTVRTSVLGFGLALLLMGYAAPASAQWLVTDARRIGLGGLSLGRSGNLERYNAAYRAVPARTGGWGVPHATHPPPPRTPPFPPAPPHHHTHTPPPPR